MVRINLTTFLASVGANYPKIALAQLVSTRAARPPLSRRHPFRVKPALSNQKKHSGNARAQQKCTFTYSSLDLWSDDIIQWVWITIKKGVENVRAGFLCWLRWHVSARSPEFGAEVQIHTRHWSFAYGLRSRPCSKCLAGDPANVTGDRGRYNVRESVLILKRLCGVWKVAIVGLLGRIRYITTGAYLVQKRDKGQIAKIIYYQIGDNVKACEQKDQDYRVINLCYRILGLVVGQSEKDNASIFDKLQSQHGHLLDRLVSDINNPQPAVRCAVLEALYSCMPCNHAAQW